MSEEDRLKGSFLFDVLVAGSLGGGGLSGAPRARVGAGQGILELR